MPATVHVRISPADHDTLKRPADEESAPLHSNIEDAVNAYGRQRFQERANAAYAALKSDSIAWGEEQEERDLCNVTLGGGLTVGTGE